MGHYRHVSARIFSEAIQEEVLLRGLNLQAKTQNWDLLAQQSLKALRVQDALLAWRSVILADFVFEEMVLFPFPVCALPCLRAMRQVGRDCCQTRKPENVPVGCD